MAARLSGGNGGTVGNGRQLICASSAKPDDGRKWRRKRKSQNSSDFSRVKGAKFALRSMGEGKVRKILQIHNGRNCILRSLATAAVGSAAANIEGKVGGSLL